MINGNNMGIIKDKCENIFRCWYVNFFASVPTSWKMRLPMGSSQKVWCYAIDIYLSSSTSWLVMAMNQLRKEYYYGPYIHGGFPARHEGTSRSLDGFCKGKSHRSIAGWELGVLLWRRKPPYAPKRSLDRPRRKLVHWLWLAEVYLQFWVDQRLVSYLEDHATNRLGGLVLTPVIFVDDLPPQKSHENHQGGQGPT